MPRQTPPASTFPRSDSIADKDVKWDKLCEITAHRILRSGFEIEYLYAMTSVQLGAELGTGVVLVVSAGSKSVRNVKHTEPGIKEGLRDMAQDGLTGKMVLQSVSIITPSGKDLAPICTMLPYTPITLPKRPNFVLQAVITNS
jgi:hypothetical protein